MQDITVANPPLPRKKRAKHVTNSSSGETKPSSQQKVKSQRKKTKKGPKVTLQGVVDTIVSRFILSWPEEIPLESTRLFFQLEQAHWFYEDFYADKYANIPHFHSLKKFCFMVFKKSAVFTKALQKSFPKMYLAFAKYRKSVPAFGAILMNSKRTKVVLAESWKHHVWGFPKGKINEGESDTLGAVREVKEEIGFDISSRLKEGDFIELKAKSGKINKLFIICNVPESTKFKIQVRKEIRSVRWFPIKCILSKTWLEKNASKGNFKNAQPFVRQLQRWIKATDESKSVSECDISESVRESSDVYESAPKSDGEETGTARDFTNFSFDTSAIMRAFA
eukprot:g2987.t1